MKFIWNYGTCSKLRIICRPVQPPHSHGVQDARDYLNGQTWTRDLEQEWEVKLKPTLHAPRVLGDDKYKIKKSTK